MSTAADEPASAIPRRHLPRGLEMREKILRVAVNEFAQRGFQGTSTRAIAKLCNVPHTLVLYYFRTKDELWITAARELFQPFIDREEAELQHADARSAIERLQQIYIEFIRFSAREPLFHRLMANEGREKSDRLTFLINSFNRRSSDALAALITEAQSQGNFIPGDPYLLLYTMVGAATNPFAIGAEFEIISGRSPFDAEVIEDHISNCMRIFFPSH